MTLKKDNTLLFKTKNSIRLSSNLSYTVGGFSEESLILFDRSWAQKTLNKLFDGTLVLKGPSPIWNWESDRIRSGALVKIFQECHNGLDLPFCNVKVTSRELETELSPVRDESIDFFSLSIDKISFLIGALMNRFERK